jgi:hypothetical protein
VDAGPIALDGSTPIDGRAPLPDGAPPPTDGSLPGDDGGVPGTDGGGGGGLCDPACMAMSGAVCCTACGACSGAAVMCTPVCDDGLRWDCELECCFDTSTVSCT